MDATSTFHTTFSCLQCKVKTDIDDLRVPAHVYDKLGRRPKRKKPH